MMRFLVCVAVAGMLAAGCAGRKPGAPAVREPSAATGESRLIVTPDSVLEGRVVVVNSQARFVVLNFPVGKMPGAGQRLGVYRRGLKVGEVRVTGPSRDDNTVADIVAGAVQAGDEARAE